MQKRVLFILVAVVVAVGALFLVRSFRTQPAATPHAFRLPNGLQAEVVPRDCGPNATITVLFAVGTHQDPPGRSGLMALVERLLSASTGRLVRLTSDATIVSVEVPREQVLSRLDALAQELAKPDLSDATVAAARQQVLADIARRSGSDATMAAVTDAAEAIFPSPGDGRRGGIATQVEHLTLADIQTFWQEHLTAGNARLVVVGDVEPDKVQAKITEAFSKLSAGTSAPTRPPREMTVTGTLVMGDAPAAVAIAVRAPAMTDRAFAPFLALAARLMEAPKPRGWQAIYDPVLEPELLYVTGPLKQGEQAEAGAARIRSEMLAVVGRPLAPEDMAAAKNQFEAFLGSDGLAACKAHPQASAVALARRAQTGLQPPSLDGLTPAETDAAQLFAPTRIAAVIAGGVVR